jgi:hypothetical protein
VQFATPVPHIAKGSFVSKNLDLAFKGKMAPNSFEKMEKSDKTGRFLGLTG